MKTHPFPRWLLCWLFLAVSCMCGTTRASDIATTYEYDSASQVTRQYVEADSQVLSDRRTHYDILGRADRTTELATPGSPDPDQDRISETIWDGAGNIVLERRACSAIPAGYAYTTYGYDTLCRRVSMTDAAANSTNPVGNPTWYVYDGRGNVVQSTDPVGNDVVYGYDAGGRQFAEDRYEPGAVDPVLEIARLYDSRGHKVLEIQWDGPSGPALIQQRWRYDAFDRLMAQTQMANPASDQAPDPLVDRITEYAYAFDTKRITTSTTNAGTTERTTQFAYDTLGRPIQITDPNGNTQTLTYVPTGTAGEGQVQTKTLTNAGLQDPAGVDISQQLFEYTYDAFGRRTVETAKGKGTAPDLTTLSQYDGLGRCTQVTDPKNIITRYTFNALGDQTQVIEDFGQLARTTDSHYDQLGRLDWQETTDGDSHTERTTYAYDLMDRRTNITFPDSSHYAYAYDAAGRTASRTDPRGQVTTYTNNWRGQSLTKTVDGTLKESFTYYPTGWMKAAWRDTATEAAATNKSAFTCDTFGQVTSVTQTVDGVAKTIASQFLASGDRSQLTYPSDLNLALTFTYDNLGQATRIDRNGQQLATYLYAGRTLTQRDITTASSPATHVTYNVGLDAHRRQAQLRNTASVGAASSLLDQYNYTYDANGNRQSAAVTGDVRLDPNTTYGYDNLDRVISADYGSGHGTESFNYDLLGNRLSSPAGYTDRQGRTTAYTHNSVNEYQTVTPSVQNPVHDGGNLTQTENGYRLEYDYENRLVTVRDKDAGHTTLATYTYDALGHRVKQVKATQTTRYYYDGETVLAEYDSTNTLQRYHIHGPTYVDEHLVLNQSGQEYYYLLTSLYSVSGLADASGKVVERYRYDAYGAATWFPPALTTRDFLRFQAAFSGDQPCSEAARVFDYTGDGKVNLADYRTCFAGGPGAAAALSPYRFTGQPLDFHLTDPTTGRPTLILHHYRARAYDAYNGRFLQHDPAEYADSMNLHEYVTSNPLTGTDPSGTMLFSLLDLSITASFAVDVEGSKMQVAMGLLESVRGLVDAIGARNRILTAVSNVTFSSPDARAIDTCLAIWEGYQDAKLVYFAAGALVVGAEFAGQGLGSLIGRGGHHSIPKWAGGEEAQLLANLAWGKGGAHPEVEQIIRKTVSEEFGLPIGGVNGSWASWKAAFKADPTLQPRLFARMQSVYREFDLAHGTHVEDVFMLNFARGNFKGFGAHEDWFGF